MSFSEFQNLGAFDERVVIIPRFQRCLTQFAEFRNLVKCIEFVLKIRSKILTIQWLSRLRHEQASRPPPQAPEWSRETWNGAEAAPEWDTEEVRGLGKLSKI